MPNTKIPYKTYLDESEMPQKWYNLRADMKNKPAPLLNPGTRKPMTAEEVALGLQKGNLKGFKQLRHAVEALPPEYKSYDGIVDYFKD